jgi:Domain of unknown function
MKQTTLLILLMAITFLSCTKEGTKYRDLLGNGEITYPGLTTNFKALQGNLRIKLQWHPSPDPGVKKYVIYWNNGLDSVWLNSSSNKPSDSVSTIISGLNEDLQNFSLYTVGEKGERSIGQTISAVRIYGPLYTSSLVNRQVDGNRAPEAVDDHTYKIFFSPVDTILNINTAISYQDNQHQMRTININAKTDEAILEMITAGTKVAMRSAYVPVKNAIDTFNVSYSDTLLLQ